MNTSDARRCLESTEAVENLRWVLRLTEWQIDIHWGRIRDESAEQGCDVLGRCKASYRYKLASIELDAESIESEDHLFEVLLHEMLHIVHASTNVIIDAVWPVLEDNETAMVSPLFSHAHERIVWQIERMILHGLGFGSVRDLIEHGSKERSKPA